MRKNRGEIIAVFTVFAVILATGVSATTPIPVVYAEEENDTDGADTLSSGGEGEQDDGQGDGQTADQSTPDGESQDGADNSTGGDDADADADSDSTSGAVTGAGTEDGVSDGNNGADSGRSDVGTNGDASTSDDQSSVDAEPDDTSDEALDDTGEETEETGLLLAASMSTFTLGNSRSVEEDPIEEGPLEFSDVGSLNTELEKCVDVGPVKAMLSGNISNASEPIRVTSGMVLTLDLDGYSISATSTAVSVDGGGSVTITGGGTLTSRTANTVNVTDGTLVLESGNIIAESRSSGGVIVGAIDVGSSGKAEIKGGKVSGKGYAVALNGGEVRVKDGTVQAEASGDVHAIHVNSGSLTVSGGRITGNGGEASGALFMQGGSARITGGSFSTTVASGYGYTCHPTGSSSLTITGGTFTLNAPAGKSLCVGSGARLSVSGGSFNGRGIGIDTGADTAVPALGEWADSFYAKLGGGVLSDNTFYKEGSIVYTNSSVSVKSGTWDRTCIEKRTLTTNTPYSFGSAGWTVNGDSTVYGSGSFYVSNDGSYTFSRE